LRHGSHRSPVAPGAHGCARGPGSAPCRTVVVMLAGIVAAAVVVYGIGAGIVVSDDAACGD
jgi:hypothetical protein